MAYGSPERLEDVPAYYADIRGGRPIRPEHLAHLVERYRRLGIEDGSPLNAVTEETRAALERALGIPVFTGMKHWTPRIADAVAKALETGASTIVGLVLAPHYSPLSIGTYRRQLEDALGDSAELAFVERWGTEPGFVDLLADRVRGAQAHVVFTAHSLPVEGSGGYRDELLESCSAIAGPAGLGDSWSFAFQSESPTGVPWLGPDILEHLRTLQGRGVRHVLACPVGFVADHLEIRWDLDVEAAELAHELGVAFERIEMPNADPRFVGVLAGLVRRALAVPSRA
jgi:ferrochelatase